MKAKQPPDADAADVTPGRPKESGSRQQTVPGQNAHSGSPGFDKNVTADSKPPSELPKPDREN
jgi:hypothetical protein